jgi:hypothetical protein
VLIELRDELPKNAVGKIDNPARARSRRSSASTAKTRGRAADAPPVSLSSRGFVPKPHRQTVCTELFPLILQFVPGAAAAKF